MIFKFDPIAAQAHSKRRLSVLLVSIVLLGAGLYPHTGFAQSLVEGLRLYNLGDYDGAMKEWQPLANKGDPDALFNLAQIHRLGRGVPINQSVAEGYYAKAAAAGHTTAQANLATIYFFNTNGNAARRAEAVRLWQQAGAAGDASSQYMLGVLHYNGEAVERDMVTAYAWILLAVDGGHDDALQAEAIISADLDATARIEARRKSFGLLNSTADAYLDPTSAGAPPAVGSTAKAQPDTPDTPDMQETTVHEAAPEAALAAVLSQNSETSETAATSADTKNGDFRSLDGRWRVQLGSFREAENALNHRARIEQAVGSHLAGLWWDMTRLDLGADKGVYFRLLIGPLRDRTGAGTFCDDLKARGFDCFVVSP